MPGPASIVVGAWQLLRLGLFYDWLCDKTGVTQSVNVQQQLHLAMSGTNPSWMESMVSQPAMLP